MIYHFFRGNTFHLSPKIIEDLLYLMEKKTAPEQQRHFFCIMTFSTKYQYKTPENPYEKIFKKYHVKRHDYIDSFMELLRFISKANSNDDKFIFHGTIQPYKLQLVLYIYLLLFNKKKLSQLILICWGAGDFQIKPSSYINKIAAFVNNAAINRMDCSYTLSSEDLKLFQTIHPKAKSKSIRYPIKLHATKPQRVSPPLRSMVSHSGWPDNKHIDTFNALDRFKDMGIEIICPLCYGDNDYIETVIKTGESKFGDKFSYFTEIIPTEKYDELIASMHIFITATSIQTGLFALTRSLAYGVKVFAQENLLRSMREYGFLINDFKDIKSLNFDDFSAALPVEDHATNIKVLYEKYLHEPEVTRSWDDLYRGNI